jgi:hypothetical protein
MLSKKNALDVTRFLKASKNMNFTFDTASNSFVRKKVANKVNVKNRKVLPNGSVCYIANYPPVFLFGVFEIQKPVNAYFIHFIYKLDKSSKTIEVKTYDIKPDELDMSVQTNSSFYDALFESKLNLLLNELNIKSFDKSLYHYKIFTVNFI